MVGQQKHEGKNDIVICFRDFFCGIKFFLNAGLKIFYFVFVGFTAH